MPFFIVEGDITKMNTDCIVISSDVSLKPVGGMSTALYNAVKEPELLKKECEKIGFCGGCECVTTRSYGLASKYIIHSVAPIFCDCGKNAEKYMETCYKNALYMAGCKEAKSVSLPFIGTGKKGFPKDMVLRSAINSIKNYLDKYDMNIYFVVHNRSSFLVDSNLIEKVNNFINDNYTGKTNKSFDIINSFAESFTVDSDTFVNFPIDFNRADIATDEIVEKNSEKVKFDELLKNEMKKHKIRDSKLYRKCNIEKDAFARLKNDINKNPSKEIVFALTVGLEMNIFDAEIFVKKCGYSLSSDYKQNVILRYFLENKMFDIYTINEIMFYYNESQLGTIC